MANEVIDLEGSEVVQQPTPEYRAPALTTPSDLLRIAVESGADLDKLERLMALQERYDATQAKKAYDQAFAAFKAEAVVLLRSKKVTNGPLAGKGYAELSTVVEAVTPALSKHGLSSSWCLTKDDKDWLEVTCYLRHVGGHEESVSMGGPPDAGGAKNAIQARASTKSYLERYTLKAITGLAEKDDDTDGSVEPEKKKEAKKPTITGPRFDGALKTIRKGEYTIDELVAYYALTPDQQTVVDDLKKEFAK